MLKIFKESVPWAETFQWNILDIWCWSWNFLFLLHKLWYKNLNWCVGYLDNKQLTNFAKFTKCNLNEKLPFNDNSFEVIILSEVIEHLEYPNLHLNEIHRILKPHWIFILTTPNVSSLLSRILFLFTWYLLNFMPRDSKFIQFPWHISPFFPHIFSEIFKNKFKIIKKSYSNFTIPFLWTCTPIHNKLLSISIILTIEKI